MALRLGFLKGPWQLSMGLKTLDPNDWIEIDAAYAPQLAERGRLLQERALEVLDGLPTSHAGQAELLALLVEHLVTRFPDQFERHDGQLRNRLTGEQFTLAHFHKAPLALAGRLVQEDFCLMQASGDGYRLVAAVLCFPAHWRLADKVGQPLDVIHGPVPGFQARLAAPVERFFHNLRVERPVWRLNWSLVDTAALFLPPGHRGRPRPISAERAGEQIWLRSERQTFRRLPRSGDVVFGIHTSVTPLAQAVAEPEHAHALAERIRELPDAMATYKSITPIRAPLLAWLDRRAGTGRPVAAVTRQGPRAGANGPV